MDSAARLRLELAMKGLSQRDLARLIGVSAGAINHVVTGRRIPSPNLRRAIVEALHRDDFAEVA